MVQRHLLVCYTMLHLLQLPLNNHDKRSHVTGCGFKEQRVLA